MLLLWILAFNLLQLFIYRRLGRSRRPKDPTDTIRNLVEVFIANQFDLKVVDDKIPIPDLRIEYEDDCRDVRRLDHFPSSATDICLRLRSSSLRTYFSM